MPLPAFAVIAASPSCHSRISHSKGAHPSGKCTTRHTATTFDECSLRRSAFVANSQRLIPTPCVRTTEKCHWQRGRPRRSQHAARGLPTVAKLDPSPTSSESTPASAPLAEEKILKPPASSSEPAHHHAHHFSGEPRRLADDVRVTTSFVALALGVCALFYHENATSGLEFLTAYIIEYALSVDNLLVFLLIFDYFAVPRAYQSRVLTYGLTGAVVMRGIFIFFGEALTHKFKPVSLVFAAILIFSAIQLLFFSDEEEEDLSNNAVVKFSKSVLPVTDTYNADRFFSSFQGKTLATPLLLVLLVIEISDVIFALDSVPAVLGVSERTAVIYVSNVCAVLGLRSLYFILADSLGDLRFLQPALAVVLAFIGAKMSASVFGYQIPVPVSLSVVVGTLTTGVLASVLFPSDQSV